MENIETALIVFIIFFVCEMSAILWLLSDIKDLLKDIYNKTNN